MATFYKQNDKGEYVEADNDVDELFRQKSDEIVRSKLGKARERETEKLREEIEADVRKNAEDAIRKEVESSIGAEYQQKLQESEKRAKELDVQLRRKSIAAEYGFKPDAEQFLGSGDDDDMRAKADALKTSFTSESKTPNLEKETSTKNTDSFVKLVG